MPLMGKQPELVEHMKEVRERWLPEQKPDAIVVFSAHWESDPIKIIASEKPSMLYDYAGFPRVTYEYEYPAPGHPQLAQKIHELFKTEDLESELDKRRGFDHGVFIPLMIMFPEADIPVVAVSLHASLSAEVNIRIGQALAPLRDDNVLFLGSGYTFHNMDSFFHPSDRTHKVSVDFNDWLKETMAKSDRLEKLKKWELAPGARMCHPREEHLLPLLITAAAAGPNATAKLIFETKADIGNHAISSYMFA